MANASYVTSLLSGLKAEERAAWTRTWDYVLGDIAFGHISHKETAENLRGHFYTFTTPSTADKEFTIAHGLSVAPYGVIPVLPLDVVGARTIRLEVTRAADSQRVYLSSPETDVTGYVLIEG